jgi:hypothetical protein
MRIRKKKERRKKKKFFGMNGMRNTEKEREIEDER